MVQAADVRQPYLATLAAKQGQPQLLFQRLNLPADRALGQRQFSGRAGVALVPGGRLEGQQQGHGRGEVAVIHS